MSAGVPGIDYLPDNAAEAATAFPTMTRPCAGCAYTPGTEANLSPTTSFLAREAAAARCAFFCHMAGGPRPEDKTHLCAGWAERVFPTPSREDRP